MRRLLARLTDTGYEGQVVLEVSTHRAPTLGDRQADLAESLEFARRYLAGGPPGGRGHPQLAAVRPRRSG